MSFTSPDKLNTTFIESEDIKWKYDKHRSSIDLLDMSDMPSIQPNILEPTRTPTLIDIEPPLLDDNDDLLAKHSHYSTHRPRSLCNISTEDSHYKHTLSKHASLMDMEVKYQRANPTRLPTPRRNIKHQPSLDMTNTTNLTSNKPVDSHSGPTPPSSPGRRIRLSSIARLSHRPVSKEPSGKANKKLAEFDPLISPNPEDKKKTVDHITKCTKEVPSIVNKKGIQAMEFTRYAMDLNKTSSACNLKQHGNPNTRIPLPKATPNKEIAADTSELQHIPISKNKDETVIEKDDQAPMNSKIKRPGVIVPQHIKRMPSSSKKEAPIRFTRRPSFATSNELAHEQLEREREISQKLCPNLISAQGVITQPDTAHESTVSTHITSLSHDHRLEKIHERLQCLVEHKEEHVDPRDKYRPFLSPYEKNEIYRYPSVYCVGEHAKKHMASTDEPNCNYGYDDDKGDYKIVPRDHLYYRYEIIESLGKGSFGQVVKCKDLKPTENTSDNGCVAIKIIRNKKRFHAQAQTEVKILEKLMQWDPKNKNCIVRMLHHFYFRSHLCIVFECLSLNLYEILQQNSYQGFSMGLVKRFALQILTCLNLLKEHNIIHCDLKPENILLRHPDRSSIRIIDFGSSCFVSEKVFTYIQSRFYRAPEVILGLEYGLAIDMWSTGCILAELYTGHPLFPGENEPDQLACIMQLLDVPDKQYIDKCSRRKQFFDMYDQPRKAINSKGKKRKPNSLTFTEALRRSTYDSYDKDFGDFISRCLTWDADRRMKPDEALNHPWIRINKKN